MASTILAICVILLQMQQVLSTTVVKASQFPAMQRLLHSSVPTFELHSIVLNNHSSCRCGVQAASTFNTIVMGHHHYWMLVIMLSLWITIVGCSHRQQIASHLQIAAHDNESPATIDAHATANFLRVSSAPSFLTLHADSVMYAKTPLIITH